jgi:hypothetical protein
LVSLAWLVGYWGPQVRDERRGKMLVGLLELACALICFNSPEAVAGLHHAYAQRH